MSGDLEIYTERKCAEDDIEITPEMALAGVDDADGRKRALWHLARHLYEVMEWLDPGAPDDGPPDDLYERWDALDERSKHFYRLSVSYLLTKRSEVLRVLEIECPDNDVKVRRVERGEQPNIHD